MQDGDDAAERRIAELSLALDVVSMLDARTGAESRNALLRCVELANARAVRHGDPFSLVVVRLPADADAPHIVALLMASTRRTDVVASWGSWYVAVLLDRVGRDSWEVPWNRLERHVPAVAGRVVHGDGTTPADELVADAEGLGGAGGGGVAIPL